MSGVHTSNKSDVKSFSKLALIASAAATAAFVVTQARLMQRLADAAIAPPAPPRRPPQPPVRVDANGHGDEAPAEAVPSLSEAPETAAMPGMSETPAAAVEAPEAVVEPEDGDDETDAGGGDNGGARPGGGTRLRFHSARPARERLHYGLPVTGKPRVAQPEEVPPGVTSVALLAPVEPAAPPDTEDEFDEAYIALVEAITRDGVLEPAEPEATEDEPDEPVETALTATATATATDVWWLPAPRIRYILAALAYVAIAALAGSDPVSLALDGAVALTTVNSASDLVLLGWIVCGLVALLPVGTLAVRLATLATRGRLRLPALLSHETADSTGWALRLLATSGFIAGALLYSPHALAWALDTDYPVAAVASSSMSPTLHEGELIFLQGVDGADELAVGDIIAFKYRDGLTLRRVAAFQGGAVVASADARPEDTLLVPVEDVSGKAISLAGTQLKLPLLGNISLLGERTVDPRASLNLP